MKKLFLFLIFPFLFTSCTPFDAVDEKRLLIKGNVVDLSGNGINDASVQLITNTGFSWLTGPVEGVVHESFSEDSGDFSFTTFDVREDVLILSFNNYGNFQEPVGGYETLHFIDDRTERDEYLIDFGTFPLRRVVELDLQFTNTSGTTEDLSYTLEYSDISTVVPIQTWAEISEIEEIRDNTEVNQHSRHINGGQDYSQSYWTLEGTVARLTYSIGGQNSGEVVIPILAENIVHEINY